MSNVIKKRYFFYLLSIVYDGSDFFGWAIQPNLFTVQGFIQDGFNRIFKKKITIRSSSRTDKGVHALDQKIFFSLPFFLDNKKMMSLFNKMFNPFLICTNSSMVNENFNFKDNIISKEYNYLINISDYDIFARKYCLQYCNFIDHEKLNDILKIFVGKHDFFNFSYCKWKDRKKLSTTREVLEFTSFFSLDKKKIIIKVLSKGFLRYQVRAMIGEALSCYEKKINVTDLKKKFIFFDAEGKFKYKKIISPCGLYLKKVNFNFF